MTEFEYEENQIRQIIEEIVPLHQKHAVLSALTMENPTDQDFDAIGTTLTGEQRNSGFILLTGNQQSDLKQSIWGAIKKELYDLLCTTSKKYNDERKEGLTTIKGLILIVATAISAQFHVALGVIVGAVTVATMSALKIGRNAWCSLNGKAQ